MIDIVGTTISVNRKNDVEFSISFVGDEIPPDGTIVIFAVGHRTSSNYIINKTCIVEDGAFIVSLSSDDTKDIRLGEYGWNVIIQFDDGTKPWTTMLNAGRFILLPELGG